MESRLVHGSLGNDLHLLLVHPLPEQGVDSGAVLHQRDVQFVVCNQVCIVLGRVLCEPVFSWSRLRDQTLWMFRMTVLRLLDQLLRSTSMRDWLQGEGLRP